MHQLLHFKGNAIYGQDCHTPPRSARDKAAVTSRNLLCISVVLIVAYLVFHWTMYSTYDVFQNISSSSRKQLWNTRCAAVFHQSAGSRCSVDWLYSGEFTKMVTQYVQDGVVQERATIAFGADSFIMFSLEFACGGFSMCGFSTNKVNFVLNRYWATMRNKKSSNK